MLADITSIIHKRYSCRTYEPEAISPEKEKFLQKFIKELPPGPFGHSHRFEIVHAKLDADKMHQLGTYGTIHGARSWLVGILNSSGKGDLEDFGWQMECIILYATSLDIQTCWIGGTFRKKNFGKAIDADPSAIIPAISPLGKMSGKKTALEQIIKWAAQSGKRKSWEKIFFLDDFETPLPEFYDAPMAPSGKKQTTGKQDLTPEFHRALEMVRLAPSSGNFQPWTVIKDKSYNKFAFFLNRNSAYKASLGISGLSDLPRIDMGIAMCHFELGFYQSFPQPMKDPSKKKKEGKSASKVHGHWVMALPQFKLPSGIEYTATFTGD